MATSKAKPANSAKKDSEVNTEFNSADSNSQVNLNSEQSRIPAADVDDIDPGQHNSADAVPNTRAKGMDA